MVFRRRDAINLEHFLFDSASSSSSSPSPYAIAVGERVTSWLTSPSRRLLRMENPWHRRASQSSLESSEHQFAPDGRLSDRCSSNVTRSQKQTGR